MIISLHHLLILMLRNAAEGSSEWYTMGLGTSNALAIQLKPNGSFNYFTYQHLNVNQ